MTDTIENQIRKALSECADGRMSLDDFRAWFVPLSANIESSQEPEAAELAHRIDGILAEASSGGWIEDELFEELTALSAAVQFAASRPHETRRR
jgi:hypothetical protein